MKAKIIALSLLASCNTNAAIDYPYEDILTAAENTVGRCRAAYFVAASDGHSEPLNCRKKALNAVSNLEVLQKSANFDNYTPDELYISNLKVEYINRTLAEITAYRQLINR